jgi:hypothetical protein
MRERQGERERDEIVDLQFAFFELKWREREES